MKYKTLSIVEPSGTLIAQGKKTLEVRSWIPEISPDTDLLIVENSKYLRADGETDPNGKAVAIVREDIPAACGIYDVEITTS